MKNEYYGGEGGDLYYQNLLDCKIQYFGAGI